MSDQVHTADVCPDCDGLGRLLDLIFDPNRKSCSVRCGACCGTGRIPPPGPLVPQPDEWGGLDLDAELARIEANLARWKEDLSVPKADELADRIAKDADALVAVLRRADRVIRAQGRDLAEVRQVVARSQEALNDAINQLEHAQRQLTDEWPDLWVDDEDSDWPEDAIDDLIVFDRVEDQIPSPRPLTADEVTL